LLHTREICVYQRVHPQLEKNKNDWESNERRSHTCLRVDHRAARFCAFFYCVFRKVCCCCAYFPWNLKVAEINNHHHNHHHRVLATVSLTVKAEKDKPNNSSG
ncbi:unnamed protein product, partial [Sphagnum balticum]